MKYRAEKQADGNWTIFDVPVFSVHVDERDPENPVEFDEADLQRRFERMRTRNSEGYMAPLHVQHHGSQAEVKGAGAWRVRRLAQHVEGGVERMTLFVDFVNVREEVYQRIKRGELQYRSVEIVNVADPEIDSIALLDDEVPYFRYPMLAVEEKESFYAFQHRRPEGAVRAFSGMNSHRKSLCRYSAKGAAVDNPEEKKPEEEMKRMADQEVNRKILELLTKIAAKMGIDEESAEQPAEDSPAPVEQPSESMMRSAGTSPEIAGTLAAMQAKIKSQDEALAELKAEREVETEAANLISKGYTADVVAEFRATARKEGLSSAKAFARGMAQFGPSDPPRHWTGETNANEIDPPEVAKYAAQGPAQLAKAREIWKSHRRTQSPIKLASYLEANLSEDIVSDARRGSGY